MALSDSVNHPLISEMVESAQFNEQPRSTMRRLVPYNFKKLFMVIKFHITNLGAANSYEIFLPLNISQTTNCAAVVRVYDEFCMPAKFLNLCNWMLGYDN